MKEIDLIQDQNFQEKAKSVSRIKWLDFGMKKFEDRAVQLLLLVRSKFENPFEIR